VYRSCGIFVTYVEGLPIVFGAGEQLGMDPSRRENKPAAQVELNGVFVLLYDDEVAAAELFGRRFVQWTRCK
jgi:hypothetical protein